MEETPATLPPEPEETGVQPNQYPPTQEQSKTLVPAVSGTGIGSFQLSDSLRKKSVKFAGKQGWFCCTGMRSARKESLSNFVWNATKRRRN